MNFENLPETWKVVRLGKVTDISPGYSSFMMFYIQLFWIARRAIEPQSIEILLL